MNIYLNNPTYCKRNTTLYTLDMNLKDCDLLYLYIKHGLYFRKALFEVKDLEWPTSKTVAGKWWLKKKKVFLNNSIILKISQGINKIKIRIVNKNNNVD